MPPRPRFDRRAPVRELPNINDRISYPQLRVVDADGEQLGVIDREKALEVARERELDLVLVSEKADPPVCRIMDYGKFKFEQEKKAKEAKKKSHQTEVKEVKMRYKIDSHDYDVRIGQAQRFLKAGDKVKCTVIFRGREIQHTALFPAPSSLSFFNRGALRGVRNMIMLRPSRFGGCCTSAGSSRSLAIRRSNTSANAVC